MPILGARSMGKRWVWSGGRGTKRKMCARVLLWFPKEGMGGAGSAGLGLASLNLLSGSGAQGLPLVTWYLALSDEVRGITAQNVRAHRGGGGLWIRWLAHEKHTYFCLLSPGINQGGAVPPESARPQMSKHQNKRCGSYRCFLARRQN